MVLSWRGKNHPGWAPTSAEDLKNSAKLCHGKFGRLANTRLMDTDRHTDTRKQCIPENKCMGIFLDIRNGFEIHHAVKVVI